MSNQSSSKEGRKNTNEKDRPQGKNPQVELKHLPPPPLPLDPSSSSSTVPSSHHDPPHVVTPPTSASDGSVAAQLAQLFSIVGRLSAENGALRAQVDGHFSTIAQLSTENEELRLTMEEISKAALPGGHWVWESGKGGGKGRWLWSNEKRTSTKTHPIHTERPTFLDSLPTELIRVISGNLVRSDILSLSRVSFRVLESVVDWVYGEEIIVDTSRQAVSFVLGRLATPPRPDDRIKFLLLSQTLIFELPEYIDLLDFAALPDDPDRSLPLISINGLAMLHDYTDPPFYSLARWSPLFRLLNPTVLRIGHDYLDVPPSPTTFRARGEELSFASRWNRLRSFIVIEMDSIPLHPDGSLAFSQWLKNSSSDGERIIEMSVVQEFKNGSKEKAAFIEGYHLETRDLGDGFVLDSKSSCFSFRARVVEGDGGEEVAMNVWVCAWYSLAVL